MRPFSFISLKMSRENPRTPREGLGKGGFLYRDMYFTRNHRLQKGPKMREFSLIYLKIPLMSRHRQFFYVKQQPSTKYFFYI